ncbi:hypothetical protein D5272_13395 [bacterium D16-76]|jgi:hypothetical protein|nr:ssDNA-binding domain-containing protein [Lachnospiraceae bacterium]NBK79553.1 hypothetical protein [bacterium D16-76]
MNQKIEFSQFINNQKQLREQTGKLTADTVERVWGDMEEFPRLLDVAERFNLASGTLGGGSANALLIYAQCPHATRLGSFEDWKKEQAYIRKGEKGLRIYVRSPGKEDPKTHRTKYYYNVEHRFDISQTNAHLQTEDVSWTEPLDIIRAIAKTASFGIQYDPEIPDGVNAAYIPELNEVRVRDGQDAEQMCISLLTEFCHYEQHKLMGKTYERNPNTNFVALCGGYVLARRFGVSTENVLFQREVFPEIPGENMQEKCGAVRDLLSRIIRASGMAGQEIQKGITELERDMGLYVASPRYRPEEARAGALAV